PFTSLPPLPPSLSFNAPPPPATSPLSLHDALPISRRTPPRPPAAPGSRHPPAPPPAPPRRWCRRSAAPPTAPRRTPCRNPRNGRSEEHTSELQSRENLVCRLLLEKKKRTYMSILVS